MKPTRWRSSLHDPKVLPGTAWWSWWRHWSRRAGLQTHGHTMEPLRGPKARPGLLLWPLVRGTDEAWGRGRPWGQIPPVILGAPPKPCYCRSG